MFDKHSSRTGEQQAEHRTNDRRLAFGRLCDRISIEQHDQNKQQKNNASSMLVSTRAHDHLAHDARASARRRSLCDATRRDAMRAIEDTIK